MMKDEDKSKSELLNELRLLRKRLHELETEQLYYKLIIDNCNDAILLTSPDGRIFFANTAACKLFGMTEEKICMLRRNGIVDKSDPNLPILLEKLDRKGKVTGELNFIKGDNSKFLGEITSVVFYDSTGKKRTGMSIKNVTESSKAEARDKFLADILKKVSDAVIAVDENMRITYWNDAAELIYGWTSDEMIGKVIQDVLSADFIETTNEVVQTKLNSTGFWKGELVQQNKNGKMINVLATTSLYYDREGRLNGAVTINRDISERKKFEEALRTSELRYRTIFELAPIGISLLNANRQIIAMNPALERITKLSSEELLIGKFRQRTYIRPDYTEMTFDEFASVRALKEKRPVYDVTHGIITESGDVIWTKVNACPIDLPEPGVVVITEDITARKINEETLKLREKYLQMAQSIANMGNWIWDIKNNSLTWSDTLYRIMGVDKDSFVLSSENIVNLIHPDDRELNQKKMNELLTSAGKGEFEFRVIKPDQQICYIFQAFEVFRDENGSPQKAFGIMTDITERKKSEEKLRALSTRLHTVREEEKIYLARELHDNIGQSLTGLKMDLVWIQKHLPKFDDDNMMEAVEEKLKSVIPMTDSLIQSIRQISADLRPNILDTLGLIPAIEWQLEELKKRTNINYEFTHNINVINLEQLQSTAVYRIIQELITNIIRHSNATKIVCRALEDNDSIIIQFEDNGIGITDEDLSDINSLGIMGMRERANLLGGEITFLSGKGNGTKATLIIPKEKVND